MTFSHIFRKCFFIISLWASLTAVLLVGLFAAYDGRSASTLVAKNGQIVHSVKQSNPVQVAGEMIELTQDPVQTSMLPEALFVPEGDVDAVLLAKAFQDALPVHHAITSPERAAMCTSRCEDIDLIFYLERRDGTRIKERHAKSGTLYAVRDELDTVGPCHARYTLQFEDTIESDTQLTDFDYNDVIVEVERQEGEIVVRPVYMEASDDARLGVSVYSNNVFDRDVVVFDSLVNAIRRESGRPGAGTVRASITPTLPAACNLCAYACQDVQLHYHTAFGVNIEKTRYVQGAACDRYERLTFVKEITGEILGVIDTRQVGTYVSFIPVDTTSTTLPVSLSVVYRDGKQQEFLLYKDLSVVNLSNLASNLRVVDITGQVPALQCLPLEVPNCTPSCRDVTFSLVLTDSLGNTLVENTAKNGRLISEREELYWKNACEHSYLIAFDDPLTQGEPFRDVWVRIERRETSLTVTPILYESNRDYRLDLVVSGPGDSENMYEIAPSLHQWLAPGSAAKPFTFTYNLHSSNTCPEGISWR